jgi:O-antigen/teichoic acid export membrane protein
VSEDAHHPKRLQSQAVRGSLWTLVSTAGTLPLTLISLVIAGRVLGPEGFGRYSLYAFYIPLGLTLMDLGLASSLTWAAATGRVEDASLLHRTLRAAVTWSVLKIPIAFAGTIWLLSVDPPAAGVTAICVAISLYSQPIGIAVTADRNYKVLANAALVSGVISAVALSVTALVTESAEWATAAFWLGKVVSIPVYWRGTPRELRRSTLLPGRLALDRTAWTFGLSSYAASALSLWVFGRSELAFLERSGDATSQGRFALASTVAQRATLLADSLYGALGIAMVALRSADPARFIEGFQRSLRLTTVLAIATTVLVTPVASLGAPVLFGSAFGDVGLATALLLQVALLRTALQPVASWIYGNRRGVALVVPGIVAAVVDVGLCLLLIPESPFLGALVANGVSGAVFLVLTNATAGLPASGRREVTRCVIRFMLAGTIAVAVVAAPAPLPLIPWLLLATGAATLVTFAVQVRLRPLLDARERASVADAVPARLRFAFHVLMGVGNGGRPETADRSKPSVARDDHADPDSHPATRPAEAPDRSTS